MSPPFLQNRLLELADLMLAGQISPPQTSELNKILEKHLWARQLYVEYLDVEAEMTAMAMSALPRDVLDDFTFYMPKPRTWQAQLFNRRNTSILSIVITLLVVVTIGYLWISIPQQLASPAGSLVASTEQAEWVGKSWSSTEIVRNGDRLHLRNGMITLQMGSGTLVDLKGPIEVEVKDQKLLGLAHGTLKVLVPQVDKGFTVETPRARIVDQGTEFLITHEFGIGTQVSVREGLVEAYNLNDFGEIVNKLDLTANRSVKFDLGQVIDTLYSPEQYQWFDRVRGGISRFEGLSQPTTAVLGDLRDGVIPTTDHVLVIPECRQLSLTERTNIETLEGVLTLEPGEILSSYLVHYDPGLSTLKPPIGAISFEGTVIGVIVKSQALNETDRPFGNANVVYNPNTYRGLEQGEDLDQITITNERQTVQYNLDLTAPVFFDEFRILVREQ